MIRSISLRRVALFALALGIVPATAALAGNTNGFISPIVVQGNVAVFSVSSAGIGKPACATTGRWAFDESTAAGQAMLSALLTAYAGHRNVAVFGNGTCNVLPDSETVSYIAVY